MLRDEITNNVLALLFTLLQNEIKDALNGDKKARYFILSNQLDEFIKFTGLRINSKVFRQNFRRLDKTKKIWKIKMLNRHF